MTAQPEIAIEHVPGSAPAAFRLTRYPTGKSLDTAVVPSPYEFEVGGRPDTSLMRELRWYLESFLDRPYHPDTIHAEEVLAALEGWGSRCFDLIFNRRDAGEWLDEASVLRIKSDDPVILSWPWEALFDPQSGYLVHHRRMERQLNKLGKPPKLAELPKERVNILLVVARPYEADVSYRSIARPLVELVRSKGLPAHVEVLRPPTFDQLRAHLESHPGYYHVLHFDGHGGYGASGGGGSPLHGPPGKFKASQGELLFEDKDGKPDPRSAEDLSMLLREYAVPAVVMNACQAGMLDETAEDAFASVATALLRSGMRSVVAMSYSLYVSGAQAFLPAFYSGLFKSGSVAEGVRAGRRQMLSQKKRTSPRGPYEFEDWLLPVLYQQEPFDFSFAAKATVEAHQSRLPAEVLRYREEDFVGRDGPILTMERALQRRAPCILVQGMGGIGKTTLVRGFLFWLDETGGLDAALWFDFRDIRSAEFVLNRTGELFYGENFALAKNKPELLAQVFRQNRVVMVWDNFESAAANLTSADRAQLGEFLQAIRGTQGKVIVTSRDAENWMEDEWRSKIELPGLVGDERWEFCEAIVSGLGLGKVDREDPAIVELMKLLNGHPLAMRVVLSKLQKMTAGNVLKALRTNIADLGLNPEKESENRVFATLRFVEQGLAEELRPMLGLVGLHESYLDADYMEAMAKQVDPAWTRPMIDRLVSSLAAAGLLTDMGQAIYQMHPLLTSYLRSIVPASEECQREFAEIMAVVANRLAPLEEHEQRFPFLLHGANFHAALRIADSYAMDDSVAALRQSIASFARNSRDFVQATRLYRGLAEQGVLTEDWDRAAMGYHQLGIVAQEERDFKAAREWYTKALSVFERQGDLIGAANSYHQLGVMTHAERDFSAAREWYLKSLAVEEKRGNLIGAAISYHQLGMLAQEERDFPASREWYLKSLAIKERLGNRHGAALTHGQLGRLSQDELDFKAAREWYLKALSVFETLNSMHEAAICYHQLGVVAQLEGDLAPARLWYLKSLAIEERQGNLHGAAITYHQLGRIAEEQHDFTAARAWYSKCIDIKVKQGDLHGAALTYHQIGSVAQEEGDLVGARDWYLKSLAIKEQLGDQHGAAKTYAQLGAVAWLDGDAQAFSKSVVRAIKAFIETSDPHLVRRSVTNFLLAYQQSSPENQKQMEAIWQEAGLGPFPPPQAEG
jgi:tetratricopeptide (TPR) repeat protein